MDEGDNVRFNDREKTEQHASTTVTWLPLIPRECCDKLTDYIQQWSVSNPSSGQCPANDHTNSK